MTAGAEFYVAWTGRPGDAAFSMHRTDPVELRERARVAKWIVEVNNDGDPIIIEAGRLGEETLEHEGKPSVPFQMRGEQMACSLCLPMGVPLTRRPIPPNVEWGDLDYADRLYISARAALVGYVETFSGPPRPRGNPRDRRGPR